MKWNKENKERLYRLIWEKYQTIKSHHSIVAGRYIRDRFLFEFGIEKVQKGKRLKDRVNMTRAASIWMKPHTQTPAKDKNRIIILDPWYGKSGTYPKLRSRGYVDGLSIPKDVAEKFLILGVP